MQKFLIKIVCLLIPLLGTYIGFYLYNDYHATMWYSIYMFIFGVLFGLVFALIGAWAHNITINSYKRKLEKESVSSEENSARVKVLESKIQVLEKALENAINGK